MLGIEQIERPDSLKDLAYRRIRALLDRGQLPPRALHSANQLAETLGVSRTPVREALLQLAAEGFLSVAEGRGFRVREFSPKETEDFFETRRLIETFVARELAPQLAPDDLAALDLNLRTLAEQAAAGDLPAFLETDREFHLYLVRRYRNLQLESIMERIQAQIPLFGSRAVAHHPGRCREVVGEHGRIVDALRRRDPAEAAEAVFTHLAVTQRFATGATT
jgi:DNA-binding GntR family transcriptional regulator